MVWNFTSVSHKQAWFPNVTVIYHVHPFLSALPHTSAIQYSYTHLPVKTLCVSSTDSCLHFVKTTHLLQGENVLCSSHITELRPWAFVWASVHSHKSSPNPKWNAHIAVKILKREKKRRTQFSLRMSSNERMMGKSGFVFPFASGCLWKDVGKMFCIECPRYIKSQRSYVISVRVDPGWHVIFLTL